jgi:light-regulated signal transduction histidine kinase (bacteriophytochrome)
VQWRTAQLKALNQELETFNYSVSHDLGAPLRRIQGFIGVLEQDYADKLDTKGIELLQTIVASSKQMKTLIDALLRLARLSNDELRPQPTDLSKLAHSLAADLQQSDPDRKVTFVVAENIMANGDPALLRVLLENLMNNAWKFTRQQASACIEFGSTFQPDKTVVNFVRDNGAGFNMSYAGKLFGAFQRFHTQDEFPGTGIGLASVQRVVHRHAGQIWAQSAVGEGATFYFTLNCPAGSDQREPSKAPHGVA